MKNIIFSIWVLLLVLILNGNAHSISANKMNYVEGEVIVKFRDNLSTVVKSNIVSTFNHNLINNNQGSQFGTVQFSKSEKIDDVIALYQVDANVLYAQPNYIYQAAAVSVPVDSLYIEQWALKNTSNNVGTAGNDIDAEQAWAINTDCSLNDTVIAVIDTGVNYLHQDLESNTWFNAAELAGVANVDDDGNGKIDDIHGWNFIDNNHEPRDTAGHGTMVAGIIGAQANNAAHGTVGVCWKSAIMALKVADATTYGFYSSMITSAIDYAINNGATIINMSFYLSGRDAVVQDQITAARDKGIIIVTAAANDATDNEINAVYPCNYQYSSYQGVESKTDNLDNIICVASVDENYQLSTFSNYGNVSVDIAAPGSKIIGDWPVRSDIFVNQGFDIKNMAVADVRNRIVTLNNFSRWNSVATTIGLPAWLMSLQKVQIQGSPLMMNILSDPSGTGINYSPSQNTFISQSFIFPPADAYTMTVMSHLNLPRSTDVITQKQNSDYIIFKYGAGSTTLNTKLPYNNVNGIGSEVSENEIPKDCLRPAVVGQIPLGQPCSVGIGLVSDANTTVGTGIDIYGIQLAAINFDNTAHKTLSGTSMSSPHVAGVAALVRSYNYAYNYRDVIQAVLAGGETIPALLNKTVTGKTVNAFGSLTYIQPPKNVTASFVQN